MEKQYIIDHKVIHDKFGTGEVQDFVPDYISIYFHDVDKKCKFKYPEAFDLHLKMQDGELQDSVNLDLLHKKAFLQEEESIRQEKIQKFDEELSGQHRETLLRRRKAVLAKKKKSVVL